jgi:hypothetical protein
MLGGLLGNLWLLPMLLFGNKKIGGTHRPHA